jgi:hypothetical protein
MNVYISYLLFKCIGVIINIFYECLQIEWEDDVETFANVNIFVYISNVNHKHS